MSHYFTDQPSKKRLNGIYTIFMSGSPVFICWSAVLVPDSPMTQEFWLMVKSLFIQLVGNGFSRWLQCRIRCRSHHQHCTMFNLMPLVHVQSHYYTS